MEKMDSLVEKLITLIYEKKDEKGKNHIIDDVLEPFNLSGFIHLINEHTKGAKNVQDTIEHLFLSLEIDDSKGRDEKWKILCSEIENIVQENYKEENAGKELV